jgi:hypothetical protein
VCHPKTTSDGVNSIWHANKKIGLITLLHRYIRVVLCVGAAVFGGQAGFGHHGKGGLVERVCRVVKVRDAQCGAIFSSRPPQPITIPPRLRLDLQLCTTTLKGKNIYLQVKVPLRLGFLGCPGQSWIFG